MGDLDLLVSSSQLERSRAALERAGYRTIGTEAMIQAYRPHHFAMPLAHASGFVVEIPWALSRARVGFQLDERAFLSRTISKRNAAVVALRVPSAEDMILHLASQNEEDAFGRVRRLVDLHRVVASTPQLDWAYLGEATRQGGVQTSQRAPSPRPGPPGHPRPRSDSSMTSLAPVPAELDAATPALMGDQRARASVRRTGSGPAPAKARLAAREAGRLSDAPVYLRTTWPMKTGRPKNFLDGIVDSSVRPAER